MLVGQLVMLVPSDNGPKSKASASTGLEFAVWESPWNLKTRLHSSMREINGNKTYGKYIEIHSPEITNNCLNMFELLNSPSIFIPYL